jgi:flavin reductase (DIM6/NTAB) family NADH-FMN oxidoreductase RutF
MALHEVDTRDLMFNPFSKVAREWMLITAGTEGHVNTMTASWGAMGEWWGHDAITCYIRQSRYTKEFVDANPTFSVSFFDESWRDALNLCGTVSGRDVDKIKQAGLTVEFVDGTPVFKEASLAMVCHKLYAGYMPPEQFVDPQADARWYADKDYHTMYIGGIDKTLAV